MNFKVISLNVGRALLVSALFMMISMIVSACNGMDSAFGPLAVSFIITFICGAFPFIFVRNSSNISISEGFVTVVLSWILSFIFGMLPYILWGGEFTLINAWFESVSGFTTTGATILTNVECLPKGLLFWRSSTHFIGGLGVIVFLLLVLPNSSPFRLRLARIELSSLSRDGYNYRSGRTVYVILAVYMAIFLLCALSLFLAGMSGFDAVNHAFSVAATGGFSTKNLSIAGYNSVAINLIVTVFSLASVLHYGLIFTAVVKRNSRPLRNNPLIRFFFMTIVAMTVIVMISLMLYGGYHSWIKAFGDAFFQVCSYVTTTGLGMSDNSNWPFLAGIVLLYASIQCGLSGSTSGGLKVDRVYVIMKSIGCHVRSLLRPNAVSRVRIGNNSLEASETQPIFIYLGLYCTAVIIGVFLLLLCGVGSIEAISGSVASMGNVGIALGDIGSLGSYAHMPIMAKVVCSIEMFLGRIEIYPIMMIFFLIFNREK